MTSAQRERFIEAIDLTPGAAAERAIVALAFARAAKMALRASLSVECMWSVAGDTIDDNSHETKLALQLFELASGHAVAACAVIGLPDGSVREFIEY